MTAASNASDRQESAKGCNQLFASYDIYVQSIDRLVYMQIADYIHLSVSVSVSVYKYKYK